MDSGNLVHLSREQKEKILFEALRIRIAEETLIELYPSDVIQSPVHLSIGQELHTAAIMSLLAPEDRVFTTYRSHATYLAKGGDMNLMFAELYGKQSGISHGKAGSMHLCHPETGLMGSSAIVGAVYSHAMGAAYADKINKTGRCVVCITGEGATEEGTFHECLNFTSLKKIPLVYVIENNGLAINIQLSARQSYSLSDLVAAYGVNYYRIKDSFNADEVVLVTKKALDDARSCCLPSVVELDTYRYMEHVGISCDHDKKHRNNKELDDWKKRDPLIQNQALLEKYRSAIVAEINEAVRFAENSQFPGKDELLKDVY